MEMMKIYYLILINILNVLVKARDIIIVTDLLNSTIWVGPIETLEFEVIPLQNNGTPVAVDYDPVENKVYWTDAQRKTISRVVLDGSSQEVLIPYLSVPDGIALDTENRHMYWTDSGTDKIERANLDGSGRLTILQKDLDEPRAIVLDSAEGRIFWTDWGANPKIERAKMDGSERTTVVNTSILLPNGLAIDFTEKRLYWCDAGLNRIDTADLNGGNRINLFSISDPDIHPFDIGIYNNDIYWSDWAIKKLLKMDKYGGRDATAIGPSVFIRAGGLHIDKEFSGCRHPGSLQNGYVFPNKVDETYPLGETVEYICMDGYMLEGPRETYCTSDLSWSHGTDPVCILNANDNDQFWVFVGGGCAGGLTILILIIVLIVVCCKKSQRLENNDLPNLAVQYTAQVTANPKEDGIYNTAYDSASHPYSTHIEQPLQPTGTQQLLRKPAPTPGPSQREPSMHIYHDVQELCEAGAFGFQGENLPSYINSIGDTNTTG